MLRTESAGAGVGQQLGDADEGVGETGEASDGLNKLANLTITCVTKSVSGDSCLHVTGYLSDQRPEVSIVDDIVCEGEVGFNLC